MKAIVFILPSQQLGNQMNSVLKEAIFTVVILAISAPVMAGTVTNNTTTTRDSVGSGRTDFTTIRNSSGVQNNYSQSLKMESLGEFADAEVTFKDGKLSGNASASTDNPVDPYAIGVYSTQSESISFTQLDVGSGYEKYSFTENTIDHRVGADSGF